MNLGDFQKEIEEELARMKPGNKKKKLEKMYNKLKGKKILKVGDTIDDVNIDKKKKKIEKKIEKKLGAK